MKTYFLIDTFNGLSTIVDKTVAENQQQAENYFFNEMGWLIGEVVDAESFKNDLEIASFENQSHEQ